MKFSCDRTWRRNLFEKESQESPHLLEGHHAPLLAGDDLNNLNVLHAVHLAANPGHGLLDQVVREVVWMFLGGVLLIIGLHLEETFALLAVIGFVRVVDTEHVLLQMGKLCK